MTAIETHLPISQLDPSGSGGFRGTQGPSDVFISPSQTPGRTSAMQKQKFTTQNYPDAFIDRALRIRDSTEDIAFLYQQRWQTTAVLPLQNVNDIVLHVDHFEAWPTFFAVTPEQTVAHMLTQSASRHEVKLVRFSLQTQLEHGFMGTALGQQRYAAMLNQFATSMNETANAEVARALLEATDGQQTWLQRHGQIPMDDLMNYLRWDKFVFGALQKITDNPLEIINQRVVTMMKAYGGRADTVIMTEDLQSYAQLVPIRKTRFYMGGQEAVDRVNGKGPGVDRNQPSQFSSIDPVAWLAGNAVYIHHSMVVEGQGAQDPWHRKRQIGEWNILCDNVRNYAGYSSDQRTVFVYNQDKDVMSPLTTRDGIENCMMFDENGDLRNLGEEGDIDPRYNRDARFYPFAVETNSYSPLRYFGDLSQEHFDVRDMNNLATTMIRSLYRDNADKWQKDSADITAILNEAHRRKFVAGVKIPAKQLEITELEEGGTMQRLDDVEADSFGRVTYFHLKSGEFDNVVADSFAVWNRFANDLRAKMPQSIMLDPALSTFQEAAATLWESIVLANTVPIHTTNEAPDQGEGGLLVLLHRSLDQLVKGGTETAAKFANLGEDTTENLAQQKAQLLRERPEDTVLNNYGDVNAFLDEAFGTFRREQASEIVPKTMDQWDVNVIGFVDASLTTLPAGYRFMNLEAFRRDWTVAGIPRGEIQEGEDEGGLFGGGSSGSSGAETTTGRQRSDTQGRAGEGGPERGDALMPVAAHHIPMFQAAINHARNSRGQAAHGSRSRRYQSRRSASSSSERLSGMTERVGASFHDDETFFAARHRERGFFASAARRLGLDVFTEEGIKMSIGALSSNLTALATSGMSAMRQVMAVVYLGNRFTKQALLAMDANDILLPVSFIFARPHITVETRIIVKCLSGGGSGYTYYANANVLVGDNVLTKTHTINMHFYLRSYVHRPRNVFIIPDVYVMGYHGGMGVTPITRVDQYRPDAMAQGQPCAFYFMCSYKTTTETVPNPFDVSGHMNARYRVRGAPAVERPAYDTAAYYAPKFGLGSVVGNSDLPQLYENHRNTLMYRGHQEEWDGKGGYTKILPNTGHWGHKVYAGCKDVREGEYLVLKEVAYGRGTFKA